MGSVPLTAAEAAVSGAADEDNQWEWQPLLQEPHLIAVSVWLIDFCSLQRFIRELKQRRRRRQ